MTICDNIVIFYLYITCKIVFSRDSCYTSGADGLGLTLMLFVSELFLESLKANFHP